VNCLGTSKILGLTDKQYVALNEIAAGNGVVGVNAPNGHLCRSLLRKGLIEGKGWPSDPYRLTAVVDKTWPEET
jgi:hypothetical protein